MPDGRGFEIVDTPFGKFQINPRDCVGTTTKAGTLWDGPGFLEVIAREHGRLGEVGTVILDVGANIGTFSVWLARHGAWRVLAVEPVPETMQQLKANLDLNRAVTSGVVVPIATAAYDQPIALTVATFDGDNLGGTPLRRFTPDEPVASIPALPLDHYAWLCGTRVSLIKIDAQGCDGRAILGASQIIRQHHPAVVFEWEPDLAEAHALTLPGVISVLTNWGYQVHPWPSQPNNYLAIWRSPESSVGRAISEIAGRLIKESHECA